MVVVDCDGGLEIVEDEDVFGFWVAAGEDDGDGD